MHIKNLLLATLLLPLCLCSQPKATDAVPPNTTTLSLDPTYFVLGTLSDYMGRFEYVAKSEQVDRYRAFEKPLVDYLSDYTAETLNISVETSSTKPNIIQMFSVELAQTLNAFYGEQGELKDDQFITDRQRNSFLAGVYYRYGEKLGPSLYKIQLANSPKHQNCYELLKAVGCTNILYQYLNNIPAQFILYFEPTADLKKYLDSLETEKALLQKSFEHYMEGITEQLVQDYFQEHKEYKAKEYQRVKNAFSPTLPSQ